MDRPLGSPSTSIEYVQPQYILDSVNNLFLLPTSAYLPGNSPPAHISPFIDNKHEGYVPNRAKEIAHLKGEEIVESDEDEPEMIVETAKPKKSEQKD